MKLCIRASEEIKEKIVKQLSSVIEITDDAKYALVEVGQSGENHQIIIQFNPIDYLEATQLIEGLLDQDEDDRLVGYKNNIYALINLESILFIEAYKTEVTCFSTTGQYLLKKPLYHYEKMLRKNGFVRINKSQLVNLMLVDEIIPWFNSRYLLKLKDDTQLEVSKIFSKTLRDTLDL